ncbi:hypothetical protein [Streptomyces sp. GC420]|uniref:hypothetical protein n=1 Tax=Streptomyces sp. GC420 TaxID=2697568 RepID=UPI001414EAA0|nr:hypothetical protein [Streptomyces sp. GC420]NBM17940.1 hypothetical protein [Streptomyces sp. GC420]
MAVSISAVLLLAILAIVFVRNGALKMSHALVCVLLGFLLAGSSMAPTIANGLSATADLVSGLHP